MTATDTLRERLLDEALRHVAFDGWTARTLAVSATALGLDPATVRRAA